MAAPVPVDHDPFAPPQPRRLIPVERDPWGDPVVEELKEIGRQMAANQTALLAALNESQRAITDALHEQEATLRELRPSLDALPPTIRQAAIDQQQTAAQHSQMAIERHQALADQINQGHATVSAGIQNVANTIAAPRVVKLQRDAAGKPQSAVSEIKR